MNHFTRLIELTSAGEDYVAALATSLAPCTLRPRTESSLTMEEKHAYRLLRDLFAHKDAIFTELKRMSTLTHSASVGSRADPGAAPRPRAISTDESNRKAHMEERNRLLLEKASGSRSRATSPAPGPRTGAPAGAGHRRDRSIGGPETRFPIASPTTATDRHRQSVHGPGAVMGAKRASLEVPDAIGGPGDSSGGGGGVNGGGPSDSPTAHRAEAVAADAFSEKRNSLGRSTARFSGGGRRIPLVAPANVAAEQAQGLGLRDHHHGVTLVDRPMDD